MIKPIAIAITALLLTSCSTRATPTTYEDREQRREPLCHEVAVELLHAVEDGRFKASEAKRIIDKCYDLFGPQ